MGTAVPPAPAGVGTRFGRAHRNADSGWVAGGTGAHDSRASLERLPASPTVPCGGGTGGRAGPPTGGSRGEPLFSAVQGSSAARRAARLVVRAVREGRAAIRIIYPRPHLHLAELAG